MAGLEPHGGSEQERRPTRDLRDNALGLIDLPLPVRALLIDAKTIVIERVVPDGVAFAHHPLEYLGMLPRKLSDHEKRGMRLVLRENVENPWGKFGVGSVIKSERYRFTIRQRANHGCPELAARHENGIGEKPAARDYPGGGCRDAHGECGRKLA